MNDRIVMPITSYAQNFEDVMLSRAFPGASGFYVDVGANDPDIDSVSRAFYERGWSGINLEPLGPQFELLKKRRPAPFPKTKTCSWMTAHARKDGLRN